MSSSRSMAAGVTYEDCVYVIGGYSGSSDLSSVECYNPMVRFIYLFDVILSVLCATMLVQF